MTEIEIRTIATDALTAGDREMMLALFDDNYRDANVPYLEKSFGTLRCAAIATCGGEAAGFALADMRVLDLPRLPGQPVALAGICCVGSAYRRRGLFGRLEMEAIAAAGLRPAGRILSAGRMAHPASMRIMSHNRDAIPRAGVPLTAWQKAVGRAVAQAYGVADFDDETFVCRGSGTPIGYPRLEIDVAPEEWTIFAPVNRDRGDSLLGLSWRPDAPPGWLDP